MIAALKSWCSWFSTGLSPGWTAGVQFATGAEILLFRRIRTRCVTWPPLQWASKSPSSETKWSRRKLATDLHLPRSPMRGSVPPSSYVFKALFLIKHGDSFTLNFVRLPSHNRNTHLQTHWQCAAIDLQSSTTRPSVRPTVHSVNIFSPSLVFLFFCILSFCCFPFTLNFLWTIVTYVFPAYCMHSLPLSLTAVKLTVWH